MLTHKEQTVCHLPSVPVSFGSNTQPLCYRPRTQNSKPQLDQNFSHLYPLLDIKEDPLIVSI